MAVDQHTLHQVWISIPVMVCALAIPRLSRRLPSIVARNTATQAMGKCKNHEGGVPDYLPERAVFRLQLPAFDSAVYIVAAKKQGVTILSALSMMPSPGMAGDFRDYRGRVAMSKSFLGTYFGVIEGATEVKSSLNQVG
jgi:hypothetical protein